MSIITETLHGTRACVNSPRYAVPGNNDFIFDGSSNGKQTNFVFNDENMSRGLLCIGGTGSGKTNTIKTLVKQIKRKMTDKDVMLIFDTKGDYYQSFFEPDTDTVIGTASQYARNTVSWNIFNEVTADGCYDEAVKINISEICRSITKRYASAQQPFFINAARNILEMYLLSLIIYHRDNICSVDLYNRTVVEFFRRATLEQYNDLADAFPEFNSLHLYIGEGDNPQALGVLAELQVVINEVFFGDVFGGFGDFSIRNFVRNKGGHTLFIEYDLANGETTSHLYGLLIDLAIKEALSRQHSEGNVYIIIDEFALLPNLTHITDALNFGRGLGTHIVAGLQSMAQLYQTYGKDKALSIAAGFSSMFAFRPNDYLTAEYEKKFFGENYLNETTVVSGTPFMQRRNGSTVEDWELRQLKRGEAFISIIDEIPFKFKFDKYTEY